MTPSRRIGFTLIELLVVIGIAALLLSILLPTLNRVRETALQAKMRSEQRATAIASAATQPAGSQEAVQEPAPVNPAQVKSMIASVGLTSRRSIGMLDPRSLYEAAFAGTFEATSPDGNAATLELPLPPQIISLSDVAVAVDGVASDAFEIDDRKLIWTGALPSAAPGRIDVTYTAVGSGLFCLEPPAGEVVDRFKLELTAHGSDVRMLELCMQPTSQRRASGGTTYVWDYKRLMFGRPIALDVLGIAPIDRLGELSWLGPLSVVAFGLVVGLVARSYRVESFDRWMLILVLGTFTGAYPLMYFLQEFVSLPWAVAIAAGAVLLILSIRSVSLMGFRLGIAGVIVPAGLIMGLALEAAVRPQLQGLLLTVLALALFVIAMILGPRIRANIATAYIAPAPVAA